MLSTPLLTLESHRSVINRREERVRARRRSSSRYPALQRRGFEAIFSRVCLKLKRMFPRGKKCCIHKTLGVESKNVLDVLGKSIRGETAIKVAPDVAFELGSRDLTLVTCLIHPSMASTHRSSKLEIRNRWVRVPTSNVFT